MHRINTCLTRMLIVLVVLFLGLGLSGLLAPPQQVQAQPDLDLPETPDTDAWTAASPVICMATDGNVTYIGGDFDRVGPNTGSGVIFDLPDSTPESPYLRINNTIYASTGDGAGGWYIGGYFTGAGGQEINSLAHILADGSLDPAWKPEVNGSIETIAMGDGVVYISGGFNTVNGQYRNQLAALDTATGAVTDWDPEPDSTVTAIVPAGDIIYVGGYFGTIGGEVRYGLAALDAATGLATAWNPSTGASIYTIAVAGNIVYVGGSFSSGMGGQYRYCLAALDATTGLATSWDPNPNSNINYIVTSGSTVFVGGYFSYVGGENRSYLAALDAATGLATGWNPAPNSNIESMALSGSNLYVGGYFSYIGGEDRHYLAAIDTTTGLATGWDPNPEDVALTISAQGGKLFVGGYFNVVGGVDRYGLAAIDASGRPTDWDPGCNGSVQAMEYANGLLYVGGGFDSIGGENRECLAALDPATGAATGWDPAADDYVYSLAVTGNTVYAGGDFTSIGGQDRSFLAAIDASTGLATGWNPSPSNYIYDLTAANGLIYVGGEFTGIGGEDRGYIAALDPATGVATGWNPNADDVVTKVFVNEGLVYAGGFFTSIGGEPRGCIAALDPATGAATGWDPGADFMVNAFAQRGGLTYTGGAFSYIGGALRGGLAAVDATGSSNSWNPNRELINSRMPSAAYADAAGLDEATRSNKEKAIQEKLAEAAGDAGNTRSYEAVYYYGYISDLLFRGNSLYVAGYAYSMGYSSTGGLAIFSDPALDWYMAEGATDGGMETWILVENPNDHDVKVDLSFDTEKGLVIPPELQDLTIPANSRSSFSAGAFVTSYHLSTHVVSRFGQVFCERAMYGSGKSWGSASDGATATNSAWYMAEGATDGGMNTWVVVQNPNSFAVDIDVAFQTGSGEYQPSELQNYTIAPHQRASLDVGAYVTGFDVSTRVTSEGGGVVCERSTYGPKGDGEGTWATSSGGSRGPSTSWYLAEGATDEGRETWVLVENPYSEPVDVDVKFMTGQGVVQGPVETIPGKTRRSYNACDYVTAFDVATVISAGGGGVICERALYGNSRSWATTSNGAGMAATIWNVAEGTTEGGMETWILVLNPSAADTKIFFSFQTGEGLVEPSELQNLTLAAGSRFTLRVKDYVTSYDVSTRVEAASGVVVERATYGPVGGEEAAGTLGTWATSSEGFHCEGQ